MTRTETGRESRREGGRTRVAHIEGEIIIGRPVEEVFDVVADERNEPRYNPRLLWVEKISSGPISRGTRFRAATKTMGRPFEMTIELVFWVSSATSTAGELPPALFVLVILFTWLAAFRVLMVWVYGSCEQAS